MRTIPYGTKIYILIRIDTNGSHKAITRTTGIPARTIVRIAKDHDIESLPKDGRSMAIGKLRDRLIARSLYIGHFMTTVDETRNIGGQGFHTLYLL
jgi:hypothetical protein